MNVLLQVAHGEKASAYAHFDPQSLLARLSHNVSLFHQLLRMVLADIPPMIVSLSQAVAQNDVKEVHQQSHRLKGVALNFSLPKLAKIAKKIEQQNQHPQSLAMSQVGQELEAEWQRVASLIQKTLDAYPGGHSI